MRREIPTDAPAWRRLLSASLCGVMIVTTANCARHAPPTGWLPNANAAQRDVFGGWIVVSAVGMDGERITRAGELIAVEDDSLYLLPAIENADLCALAWQDVRKAKLVRYKPKSEEMFAWTFLGTLSTLSHGFWLLLTAPFWILFGGISTDSMARSADLYYYPGEPWEAFAPYARFPRGMPPGLDAVTLRPKTLEKIRMEEERKKRGSFVR